MLVLPALAEEQLSPALMAEQKASAAGRTSSTLVINICGLVRYCIQHDTIQEKVLAY